MHRHLQSQINGDTTMRLSTIRQDKTHIYATLYNDDNCTLANIAIIENTLGQRQINVALTKNNKNITVRT